MSGTITLTGGTSWSSMYTGFSTTAGWRATIIDDLANPPVAGLKRYHLEVYVGRANRTASNKTANVTVSGAPEFYEIPQFSGIGSWTVGSGTGNQLNAASEISITTWSNNNFTYVSWENGTTGNYKLGLIFTFDGFTTYSR